MASRASWLGPFIALGLIAVAGFERAPPASADVGVVSVNPPSAARGNRIVAWLACGSCLAPSIARGPLHPPPSFPVSLVDVEQSPEPRNCGEHLACGLASRGAPRQPPLARLERRQRGAARALPRDPTGVPMSGAGGGLSGALWAHGARLVRGAPFILDAVGFDRRARDAGCVITGEGGLDASTLTGKAVEEVASRCRRLGVPCHAIVGSSSLEPSQIERLGLASIHEATDLSAITAAAAVLRIGTAG